MVARDARTDYRKNHPVAQDASLIVEVSDTTIVYDISGKAKLYARAGIADYWVVLVRENAIVVHREPTPDGYQSIVRLSGAELISLLAAPDAVWTVDALLGREDLDMEN